VIQGAWWGWLASEAATSTVVSQKADATGRQRPPT
jgi:hypothetical protein